MKFMVNENNPKYDLVNAFPHDFEKEVRDVLGVITDDSRLSYSDFMELRLSEKTLFIPYRIYYDEPAQTQISSLTAEQQTILFALYTRHYNGYVRENNVRRIVTQAAEYTWITPYLMLLIGEYVEEILQVIHDNRSLLNADYIKTFIRENSKLYRAIQRRVVSYWNCYYRRKYPNRERYVGFQLLDYVNHLSD